jgi:hypothetical protein
MSGETDKEGVAVEGPYTNIVTDKLEELGLKLTLWNDTECTQLITTVDTDGCTVVPANVGLLLLPLNLLHSHNYLIYNLRTTLRASILGQLRHSTTGKCL